MGRRERGIQFGRRRREHVINFKLLREILAWVVELAIAIMLAFVLTWFFGVRASVVGASMAPQLENADEVLVDRFRYLIVSPKAGDVIAFYPNGNRNAHYYMKRVIGVPGDVVQIKDGAVYINGEVYNEKLEVSRMEDAGIAAEPMTLGEDEYFVLGDNRNNSEDSRFANIGNVKEDYILGKAWLLVSPHSKFGRIH